MAMRPEKAGTQGPDLIDPLSSTGHLLRRAAQRYAAIWASIVTSGLTSPQFTVLIVLAGEEPLDQQTIGERAGLDKSTCGYLIDRMDKLGLVRATLDPSNRRRKLIFITQEGRECLDAALPQQQQVQRAALAELSSDDQFKLRGLLAKMIGLETSAGEPHIE
jgi:DNA-binding MarR family transcriptional regulator